MIPRLLLVGAGPAAETALLREGCTVRSIQLPADAGFATLWSTRRAVASFAATAVLAPAGHAAAATLARRLGLPLGTLPDEAWLPPPLPDAALADRDPAGLFAEPPWADTLGLLAGDWPAIAPAVAVLSNERHLAAALRAGSAVILPPAVAPWLSAATRFTTEAELRPAIAAAQPLPGAYAERHAEAIAALRLAAGLQDVVT